MTAELAAGSRSVRERIETDFPQSRGAQRFHKNFSPMLRPDFVIKPTDCPVITELSRNILAILKQMKAFTISTKSALHSLGDFLLLMENFIKIIVNTFVHSTQAKMGVTLPISPLHSLKATQMYSYNLYINFEIYNNNIGGLACLPGDSTRQKHDKYLLMI